MKVISAFIIICGCTACQTTPYIGGSAESLGYYEAEFAPGKWHITYQPTRQYVRFSRVGEIQQISRQLALRRASEICNGTYTLIEPDSPSIGEITITETGRVPPRYTQVGAAEIWVACGP
jgi:hypothetical protein